MRSSIKKYLVLLSIVTVFTSCNYGETLQSYFVANQETPDFISADVPISLINLEAADLTKEQQEAYESIDKLNMLAFTLNEENKNEYDIEYKKVKTILKDEKYQELFRGGNSTDGKFIVKYIGTDTAIDELIVFGSANGKGFAVIRVLGDNMEPAKILSLGDALKNISTDETKVKEFMNFFQFSNS